MIGVKQPERIVAEVANPAVGSVADFVIGVYLPRHPGRLKALRVGRPVVHRVVVRRIEGGRSALSAARIDRSRPQVEAVWCGRPLDRAEVVVANGVGPSQRPLEGDVRMSEMGHRGLGLGGTQSSQRPPSAASWVVSHEWSVSPSSSPFTRRVSDVPRKKIAAVGSLGGRAGRIRFRRPAGDGRLVGVAAYPSHRPVVVIERTVLLHENDHMLDIVETALPAGLGHGGGQAPGQGSDQSGCEGRPGRTTQKRPPRVNT